MEIFSTRLKEARTLKNLTQTSMATLLNIRQQSYCRYEANKGQPSLETLVKIADILEESVDYLLGRDNFE